MVNTYLKHQFARLRPEQGLQIVSGLSFPSGHAKIGGVFYGLLGYIIWTTVEHKGWRWVLSLFLTLLVLLIGFSRIYLRVHYTTDVMAGYLIGILWLMLSLYLMSRIESLYMHKYKSTQAPVLHQVLNKLIIRRGLAGLRLISLRPAIYFILPEYNVTILT